MIDNLMIGNLIKGITPDDIGIDKEEATVTIGIAEAVKMELFLPRLLVHAGIFKNTSEVKRIHKDRIKSKKITDPDSKNLWRTLNRPEMTHIKIGKRNFWLIVGELDQD